MRWHLGMLGGTGMREARLSSADAVSLTRLWLGPRLRRAGADPAVFTAILSLGAVTDVLDGRLARKRGTSRLGRDLDSLTDVAFLRAAAQGACEAGLGRPAAIAFELRLLLGPAYAAWHYFRFARPPAAPARGPAWVTKAISLAGIAAAISGRDGDLAVLSSSTAALAIQAASESRAHCSARRHAEPEAAHARSNAVPADRDRTASEW
jgi:phosphatidylglycerophosphate synthase